MNRILFTLLALVALALPAIASAQVSIAKGWVRQPLGGQSTTAAYATIQNGTDKPIVITGVSTDVASAAELHLTEQDENGVMKMRHLEELVIAPNSTLKMQRGAHHIMLMGTKKNALKQHEFVNLTFTFKDMPAIRIPAVVVKFTKKN